jgi:glyoxylate reductase
MIEAMQPPRPSVYVARRLPERVMEALAADFVLTFHDSEEQPLRATVLAGVKGVDGFLATITDRVDDELLDAAGPGLRVVANYGVGYDNIDVPALTARGVVAANTPGVIAAAAAELTIALMLALGRNVVAGDRRLRTGEPWAVTPSFMLGRGLDGLRLGIVGLGEIGTRVATLATAHGMEVVYAGRSDRPGLPYRRIPLDELLATSDVVSLHCPLTADTRHLIGRRELALMRRDAALVNTARGPVVDEAALVEALRDGVIGGAALDVYEHEPELHPGLIALENVVLVPHLGSATVAVREAMGMRCVDALRAVLLEARLPANALNATELA